MTEICAVVAPFDEAACVVAAQAIGLGVALLLGTVAIVPLMWHR